MAALSDNARARSSSSASWGRASRAPCARRARAGLEAVDADELLERELGMPIAEFFAAEGEAEFRRREEALVARPARARATGTRSRSAAAACSPSGSATALAGHVGRLARRRREDGLGAGRGPPPAGARPRDASTALLAERAAALRVARRRDRARAADDSPARALQALLALRDAAGRDPDGVGSRAPRASTRSTSAAGCSRAASGRWTGGRFMVTDTVVGGLLRRRRSARRPARSRSPPGEQTKTLAEAERVLRELRDAWRDPRPITSPRSAAGSSATWPASAPPSTSAASPVVQVPTTLVAQVDSAYGGKTGVDLPEAKNYVGAYHLPAAVLTDPATLRTLPPGELAAGFVEVLKTGADRRRAAVGARSRSLDELDPAQLDPTHLRLRSDQARGGRCGRARRRPSRGAQPRPHRRARDRGRDSGYARYRHGEAVGTRAARGARALRCHRAARRGGGDPRPPWPADPHRRLDRARRGHRRRSGATRSARRPGSGSSSARGRARCSPTNGSSRTRCAPRSSASIGPSEPRLSNSLEPR